MLPRFTTSVWNNWGAWVVSFLDIEGLHTVHWASVTGYAINIYPQRRLCCMIHRRYLSGKSIIRWKFPRTESEDTSLQSKYHRSTEITFKKIRPLKGCGLFIESRKMQLQFQKKNTGLLDKNGAIQGVAFQRLYLWYAAFLTHRFWVAAKLICKGASCPPPAKLKSNEIVFSTLSQWDAVFLLFGLCRINQQ